MSAIEEITAGRTVGEVTAWTRALVEPALREIINALPAEMRRIAEYHFGWCDEQGRPTETGGGKLVRPTLVLLAAQAVGGAPPVPAATAIEFVHNFSLLHDDVMDRDITRRHRPTVWTVFGIPSAILTGDLFLSLAFDMLAESAPSAKQLSGAVLDLLNGQSADMAFEERMHVGRDECTSMALGKTGALLGCAAALGAIEGGGTAEQVTHLRAFGAQAGLAFQHVDDLLGIWGDPAVTGKPVYSDLRNRKKSLPVVAALTSGTAAGDELFALYHRDEPLDQADLEHAAELVGSAGGREWSRSMADQLTAEALDHLRAANPVPRAGTELEMFARLATRRDH